MIQSGIKHEYAEILQRISRLNTSQQLQLLEDIAALVRHRIEPKEGVTTQEFFRRLSEIEPPDLKFADDLEEIQARQPQ